MASLQELALDCDFVRFTLADLNGISRGAQVPRTSVARALEEGVGAYSGVIGLGPGSQLSNPIPFSPGRGDTSNLIFKGVPDTFHVLPWAGTDEFTVGEILCEAFWSPSEPHGACPRYVARRQVERLQDLHGLTLWSGWEEEFILLHQDSQERISNGKAYLSNLVFNEHGKFHLRMQKMIEKSGVEIECMTNEYAPGQMELTTTPVAGVRGADTAFNLKEAVKEISAQEGIQAVFMSKPYLDDNGNGLHYNFSFRNEKGGNVFSDESTEDGLSEFARFFLGGVITHAKAVAAFCCPTVNCYRRLHCPWAPGKIAWGFDDRTAFLRVKFGGSGPYIENRLPSGAANPYLVMAATLAAGLDGVAKKIEPPPAQEQSADEFPYSLQETLQALEEDVAMTEALGTELIDWFMLEKRSVECATLKDSDVRNPTPDQMEKEREMYMKFI